MKRSMPAILAAVLLILALVLAGCGGENKTAVDAGTGGPSSENSPVGQAESAACAANRRAISSAAQQYQAMEGRVPTSIQQLVPKYLQSVPACPSGGTYTLSGTRVVCSVHGS
ncbi:hypothetical protein [Candidatus Solincola sp.]|nr:hypothetical protein [Actinomycetota bacterium]MDI7251303.1 hypothetical protein [Actinomycetota bacterium]